MGRVPRALPPDGARRRSRRHPPDADARPGAGGSRWRLLAPAGAGPPRAVRARQRGAGGRRLRAHGGPRPRGDGRPHPARPEARPRRARWDRLRLAGAGDARGAGRPDRRRRARLEPAVRRPRVAPARDPRRSALRLAAWRAGDPGSSPPGRRPGFEPGGHERNRFDREMSGTIQRTPRRGGSRPGLPTNPQGPSPVIGPALAVVGLLVIGSVSLGLINGQVPSLPGVANPSGGPVRTPTPSNV